MFLKYRKRVKHWKTHEDGSNKIRLIGRATTENDGNSDVWTTGL